MIDVRRQVHCDLQLHVRLQDAFPPGGLIVGLVGHRLDGGLVSGFQRLGRVVFAPASLLP